MSRKRSPVKIATRAFPDRFRNSGPAERQEGLFAAVTERRRTPQEAHLKLILGYHGELTPATARALAQYNLAEIHDGADPVTSKKDRREAPTVADLGQRYLDFHAVKLKPASREAAAQALRLYILPAIGKRPLPAPRTTKKTAGQSDISPVPFVRWSASGPLPGNQKQALGNYFCADSTLIEPLEILILAPAKRISRPARGE